MKYRSYAKINWYLDVLDRRADGFTNIETIFQSVNLWDELTFKESDSGVQFTCNDPALADPENNLVCRAAALLRRVTGVERGVAIHLEKNIPVAAGLAGGSGNAAATLAALNESWALGLGPGELETLAEALGSDVPFCLRGGAVAATGRGEIMERLEAVPPAWIVLVHPAMAITAGEAYSHPKLTRNLQTPVGGKTPAFQQALSRFAGGDLAGAVFNRMESGVFHDYPELAAIKTRLRDAGCLASAMSGSGPTVFGVCGDEAGARNAASEFTTYRVSVVETADHGVARLPGHHA